MKAALAKERRRPISPHNRVGIETVLLDTAHPLCLSLRQTFEHVQNDTKLAQSGAASCLKAQRHLPVLPLPHDPFVPSQLPSHPMYSTALMRPDTPRQFGRAPVQGVFERGVVDKPDTR